MNKFRRGLWVWWLWSVLVLAPHAYAAREICGNGRDDDSSGGDAACSAPDADGDMYPTTGYNPPSPLVGIDCDDNDPNVYPGAWTNSGCSANQFRKCQVDGTFTSCLSYSSLTPNQIDGSLYTSVIFCDPTKTADTGTGSFASPLNCLALSKTTMATYHAPAAGDFIIVLGTGNFTQTYNDSGTNRMLYWVGRAGTAAHPIGLFWSSGAAIVGQGVDASPGVAESAGAITPIHWTTGDAYWNVWNVSVTGNYATTGIRVEETTDSNFYNPIDHDVDGAQDNNLSGMTIAVNAHRISVYHGTFYDNYEHDNSAGGNNVVGINIMDSDAPLIVDEVVYSTTTPPHGIGTRTKHTLVGANPGYFLGLKISRVGQTCVAMQAENITLAYGQFGDCDQEIAGAAIENVNCDSTNCRFSNFVAKFNTIYGASGFAFNPDNTYFPIQKPAFTWTDTVIVDTKASYLSDFSNAMGRILNYGSDALYTDVITGGKVTIDRNCWYNTNAIGLWYSVFGDNSSSSLGATYTTWAAFAAGTGFDANSFNKNPVLNGVNEATDSSCAAMGYNHAFTLSASPSPSPSPSPTPQPTQPPGNRYSFSRSTKRAFR